MELGNFTSIVRMIESGTEVPNTGVFVFLLNCSIVFAHATLFGDLWNGTRKEHNHQPFQDSCDYIIPNKYFVPDFCSDP